MILKVDFNITQWMPAPEKPSPPAVAAPAELRCGCGRLVARWVDSRVELRCHRCKSLVYLRFAPEGRIVVEND